MSIRGISIFLILGCTGCALAFTTCRVTYPHYWQLPITLLELEKYFFEDFSFVDIDKDLNCTLYSYYEDPRVNILFNSHGNIGGLRVCYPKEDVGLQAKWNNKKFTYYYEKIPSFTERRYWGIDAWCKDILFQRPDKLKAGGRECAEWTEIWVKITHEFVQIPYDECLVQELGFTKQKCFFAMGRHYFHGMTPKMDCSYYNGVVAMYEYGKLIGMTFAIPGHFSHKKRVWFENATSDIIPEIVATPPDCWLEYANNFGLQDFHVMLKDGNPLETFCFWPWQIKDQCTYR